MASNQHSGKRSLSGGQRTRWRLVAALGLIAGALGGSARAADKPPAEKASKPAGAAKKGPAALPADAGAPLELATDVKDKLVFLSDGKQHVVAVIPFGPLTENLYYGDGKVFWEQRVPNGGQSGTEYFSRAFWDPRNEIQPEVSFRDGKYKVECGSRKTELTPLPPEAQKAMLTDAKFYAPRWKYQAYALSRDTSGRYYYVDQPRDPEQSKRFRLFAGMKGSLKLQKMVNVVSDSAGDIFATKGGSLRLVLDKKESSWNEGSKKTILTMLPLYENRALIYGDLGVYIGERLGTPCDDL